MPRLALVLLFPLALCLGACVTINVYFPTAAAQQAADRVIDEVWGGRAVPAPSVAPAPPASGEPTSGLRPASSLRWAHHLMDWFLPPARAQESGAEPDLQITSPDIQRLTDAMEARFDQLEQFYESGAIGIGLDGYVVFRDPAAVALAQRNQVRAWVANENADRAKLYREIAQANGQPQWETQIRRVFSDRWQARAPAGWYVQERDGSWRRK
jgi:uncharacterized protein YdbL (DUF1318 family)